MHICMPHLHAAGLCGANAYAKFRGGALAGLLAPFAFVGATKIPYKLHRQLWSKKSALCDRTLDYFVLSRHLVSLFFVKDSTSCDVPRASKIFLSQNCYIFSVLKILKYNPGRTNDKFITSRSFLSSDITPTSSNRKRRIIVYGLVTRYGPQSAASANG